MKFKNRKKSVATRTLIGNWSRKNHKSTKVFYTDQFAFKSKKKQIILKMQREIDRSIDLLGRDW